MFAVAVLNLIFGSIIVSFHNVWLGIPLVLTVLGWANVVNSLLYFTFPAFGLRKLQFLSYERVNLVVGGGILFLSAGRCPRLSSLEHSMKGFFVGSTYEYQSSSQTPGKMPKSSMDACRQ